MPAPLSLDLRRRILDAIDAGATQTAAAERFAVHPMTVNRLVQRHRQTGSLAPATYRHGPARALSDEDDRTLTAIVDAQNDLTLNEIAARFQAQTGRAVGERSVRRSLARSGYTRKKKR